MDGTVQAIGRCVWYVRLVISHVCSGRDCALLQGAEMLIVGGLVCLCVEDRDREICM